METPTIETLRAIALAQGYEWTDEDIAALRPGAAAALAALAKLRAFDLGAADPATQYRMF